MSSTTLVTTPARLSTRDFATVEHRPQQREGLLISPFNSEGKKPRFIVKDPTETYYIATNGVGLKLLDVMDGRRTVEGLQHALATSYGVSLPSQQIADFVDLCARNALLEADSWHVHEAAKRRPQSTRERLGFYKQLVKGDRLLDGLLRFRGWWLNPVTALLALLLTLFALHFILFMPERGGMAAPITNLQFNREDLLFSLLPLLFLIEISFHELAHGITCRLFGARAGGFGFGLLWGIVPIFFTDTTDAYTIDSKYQRAMISFAGPLVDILFLGLAAAVILVAPAETTLSRFALAYSAIPMYVLLINLNPFLVRMDGYWILADLLEQPNLRRAALAHIRQSLAGLLRRHHDSDAGTTGTKRASRNERMIYSIYGLVAVGWTTFFVLSFVRAMGHAVLHAVSMIG
ncbi:MAG: M50 family metallopeptidase [Anaerolineales bacterium]|nr:M50 family metallopeptidase [Anaerolineales bacterium]